MTDDRHRAIRAALVDAGVPIDTAETFAGQIAEAMTDQAGPPADPLLDTLIRKVGRPSDSLPLNAPPSAYPSLAGYTIDNRDPDGPAAA